MTESALELSRPIRMGEIGKGGLEFEIVADEFERAAIAARLGVEAVADLKGRVIVKRWRRSGARLTAEVSGKMTRLCVVSLEPFEVPFCEEFDVRFADPADDIAMRAGEGELILDPDSDEPPEILESGAFDAGEIILQQLVLGLDPYPRKSGVEFEEIKETTEESSPFAALKDLKSGASGTENGD